MPGKPTRAPPPWQTPYTGSSRGWLDRISQENSKPATILISNKRPDPLRLVGSAACHHALLTPTVLLKLGLSPAAKLPDRRDAGQMPRVRSGKTGRRFDQDHARADDLTHPPLPGGRATLQRS